jgi:hypothetical protein
LKISNVTQITFGIFRKTAAIARLKKFAVLGGENLDTNTLKGVKVPICFLLVKKCNIISRQLQPFFIFCGIDKRGADRVEGDIHDAGETQGQWTIGKLCVMQS